MSKKKQKRDVVTYVNPMVKKREEEKKQLLSNTRKDCKNNNYYQKNSFLCNNAERGVLVNQGKTGRIQPGPYFKTMEVENAERERAENFKQIGELPGKVLDLVGTGITTIANPVANTIVKPIYNTGETIYTNVGLGNVFGKSEAEKERIETINHELEELNKDSHKFKGTDFLEARNSFGSCEKFYQDGNVIVPDDDCIKKKLEDIKSKCSELDDCTENNICAKNNACSIPATGGRKSRKSKKSKKTKKSRKSRKSRKSHKSHKSRK